jgi:hypothetical protein
MRTIAWVGAALAALAAACGGGDAGFQPYVPPPLAAPARDLPFLQEENHTTNEVEAGVGPLVGVVVPPPGAAALDQPTQVTPRGYVRHQGGTAAVVAIPDAAGDLVAATVAAGAVYLAGADALYEVGSDGQLAAFAAPAGLTVGGLAAGADAVYLLTDQGLGWRRPGADPVWPAGGAPVTAAVEAAGRLVVATAAELTSYPVPAAGDLALGAGVPTLGGADPGAGTVRALVTGITVPQALDLVIVGDDGVRAAALAPAPALVDLPDFAADRVPLGGPRAATRAADGSLVVATAGGAQRLMDRGDGPEWRVYNAERWLPSEDVRAVATDPAVPDGPVWFATAAGLATVTARRLTLEEKLAGFVERVARRHDRDGAVADSHLTHRGDLGSNVPWDSDNDGSWTSYWLLAECSRYAATGAADAKAHFDESLDAMLRLRDVTGTDWFIARSVIRKAGCQLDDCDGPDDGAWYTSPDGAWWVKRDTSNDEVIAHFFMMGPAYDLCADETQRGRIRDHLRGLVGGLIDHGYQLIDPVTNAVTTYGQLDPDYVNHSISGRAADGGTRAAELLAGLTLAHYVTGEARFAEAKRRLMEAEGYADAAEGEADYPMRGGSGDLDEMATEAWFVLLRYEPDPALRARWLAGWGRTYAHLQTHQAAWWNMVNAVVGGAAPDLAPALRWLRTAPVDMIRWDQHNSQRHDLAPAPPPYDPDGRMRSDGRILPSDERRCDRWNTDQFRVDGGMGGWIEMDGADVLAPYWMGRTYGLIAAP